MWSLLLLLFPWPRPRSDVLVCEGHAASAASAGLSQTQSQHTLITLREVSTHTFNNTPCQLAQCLQNGLFGILSGYTKPCRLAHPIHTHTHTVTGMYIKAVLIKGSQQDVFAYFWMQRWAFLNGLCCLGLQKQGDFSNLNALRATLSKASPQDFNEPLFFFVSLVIYMLLTVIHYSQK